MSKRDRRAEAIERQKANLTTVITKESYRDKYDDMIKKTEKPVINVDINALTPAPKEWNFFPEISEEKMLEMMFSILENGLFNPIIVWEIDDNPQNPRYMILSGHNRVRAYKRILREYQDAPRFNKREYETIPAIVYRKNEIDELKAKEIIIDTNYIQRDEDKRLIPQIIKNRLEIVRGRKDVKGRTIDIVAEELGISATKVYEDQLIANRIIPELNEFYFNNELKKKSLLRFAWFDKEIQKWIYRNFKDKIIDDNVMRLKKNMSKEEIRSCFEDTNYVKKVSVSIKVPEFLKDEFKEMAIRWLTENELQHKTQRKA